MTVEKMVEEFLERRVFERFDKELHPAIRTELQALVAQIVAETVERCAKVAEAEPELPGDCPDEIWGTLSKQGKEEQFRGTVRSCKKAIARRIRSLADAPRQGEGL